MLPVLWVLALYPGQLTSVAPEGEPSKDAPEASITKPLYVPLSVTAMVAPATAAANLVRTEAATNRRGGALVGPRQARYERLRQRVVGRPALGGRVAKCPDSVRGRSLERGWRGRGCRERFGSGARHRAEARD